MSDFALENLKKAKEGIQNSVDLLKDNSKDAFAKAQEVLQGGLQLGILQQTVLKPLFNKINKVKKALNDNDQNEAEDAAEKLNKTAEDAEEEGSEEEGAEEGAEDAAEDQAEIAETSFGRILVTNNEEVANTISSLKNVEPVVDDIGESIAESVGGTVAKVAPTVSESLDAATLASLGGDENPIGLLVTAGLGIASLFAEIGEAVEGHKQTVVQTAQSLGVV